MEIAVIITCFNRKQKTIACLKSLYLARDHYKNDIRLHLFLTDDGCSDGTAEAVRNSFPQEKISVIKGSGNLFWAGGMRLAWREALSRSNLWDFYLLLNDDTLLLDNAFEELFFTYDYALKRTGKKGICVGEIRDPLLMDKTTYGGAIWQNRLKGTYIKLDPTGSPQQCDLANANILLVSKDVVDNIGIFNEGYKHGCADYDYSFQAEKAGFPVLVTPEYCGTCSFDHKNMSELAVSVMSMSLKQRVDFFNHPLHSNSDYLRLVKRTCPYRYPFVAIGRVLNVFFPHFYYKMMKGF